MIDECDGNESLKERVARIEERLRGMDVAITLQKTAWNAVIALAGVIIAFGALVLRLLLR